MKDTRDRKTKICPICGGAMYKDAFICKNCRSQSGENNGNWKGGARKSRYAYKLIQKERYPERVKARDVLVHAIKDGRIKRGACEVCGEENAQAHHDDYSKPLEVRWLCRKHHAEIKS